MAKRPCARPGCAELVDRGGFCAGCAPRNPKALREKLRGSAAARGYGRRWQKTSAAWLVSHPLCVDPYGLHGERPERATLTDHIVPRKGDMDVFWDSGNWQSLCSGCHSRKTAEEDGGFGHPVRAQAQGWVKSLPRPDA